MHKLLLHRRRPDRLWQQNHCGVYRSDDGGGSWERLDGNGLPLGFGFPIALDPSDPDIAFVIPEEGAENRVTANGRLGVYRTDDGGASWGLIEGGLPEPRVGRRAARGDELRRGRRRLLRHAERPRLRARPARWSRRRGTAADPVGRSRDRGLAVATVLLPGLLATEAGGRRIEVDAEPSATRCARCRSRPALRRARQPAPARQRLRGRPRRNDSAPRSTAGARCGSSRRSPAGSLPDGRRDAGDLAVGDLLLDRVHLRDERLRHLGADLAEADAAAGRGRSPRCRPRTAVDDVA